MTLKKLVALAAVTLAVAGCGGGTEDFVPPTSCDNATERVQAFYRDVTADLGEAAKHPEWQDIVAWATANECPGW